MEDTSHKTVKNPFKYLLVLLGSIFGFIIITVLVIGLTLDEDISHTRYCQYNQSPQKIWNLINDLKSNHLWRKPHLTSALAIPATKEQGEIWQEIYLGGDRIDWEVIEKKEPHLIVRKLKNSSVQTQWKIEIKEIKKNVSQVTISEKGKLSNPFTRFIGKVSFGTTYVDQYLMDIAYAYNETPKILTIENKKIISKK